jgi:hypothetical protein
MFPRLFAPQRGGIKSALFLEMLLSVVWLPSWFLNENESSLNNYELPRGGMVN